MDDLAATWARTALTLAIAAFGAAFGHVVGLPAYLLTGPAIAVSGAGLAGLRLDIHPKFRDAAFVVIGVGIGSTVTAETTAALARWPLAFAALALALVAIMAVSQWLLRRFFGFDSRGAILASAPGHLSFVLGLSAEMRVDVMRVTVVQSVRLLSLTLLVPVAARLAGIEITGLPLSGSAQLPWLDFAVLIAAGWALARVLVLARVPAALLIGAMVASAVAHGADWTYGGLHPALGFAAFITLGGMIGTRFSGVGMGALASGLGAGLASTVASGAVAFAAAVPVAMALGMPPATVLAGFAPGGFETMIALGAVLGANPGFVAGCHVARLIFLTGLIPLFLARAGRREA
jgi:membrane AbrB-like protein